MTDVTVIGSGPMGAALARTLLGSGQRVTVWNRTAAKAEALARSGAAVAPSAADAVAASPIVIVCINDYATTRDLLESADVGAGRVIVQLTTGTPQDARQLERWVRARDADYLDGAIMATPSQIGRPDTPIYASGAEHAYRRSEPAMRILAGNLVYLGEPAGLASAWDLATLSALFGALAGFLHGARIFESENLRVADLGDNFFNIAPVLGEMIRGAGARIQAGAFGEPESTISTCAVSFELFQKQAREARINVEFPQFVLGLARRAIAAGDGDSDFAAMIKVLRAAG